MATNAAQKLIQSPTHPSIVHSNLEPSENLRGKVLLLKDATPLSSLQALTHNEAIHVVADTSPHVENEIRSALLMLESPQTFFKDSLQTILDPESILAGKNSQMKMNSISFNQSQQKKKVLAEMMGFATELPVPESSLSDLYLVADELFTNAIYNAPFVRSGVRVDRSREIVLEHGFGATMAIGTYDEKLALVCEDPYGSLKIPPLLKRVQGCYETNARDMINWGRGGAGIGSFLVMECCTSLYWAVLESRKTVVGAVFPLGKGRHRRSKLPKCLHTLLMAR